MGNYSLDSELKSLSKLKPVTNRFLLGPACFVLRLAPKGFDKKKVRVEYFQFGETRFHMVTPLSLIDKASPCLFYIHGGGFIYPESVAQYHYEEKYALGASCRVIGVDYPLSPKHCFPEALERCFAVYDNVIANHEGFNVDPDHIVVAGDSAGGLLALDLCLRIQEEKKVKPKGLLLVYPVTDHRLQTESMKRYADTPCWNNVANKKMWDYYLQGKTYRSPLERADEFDIKRVYIELCEFDCLHDEGALLFEALKKKASHIELNDTKGTVHGYDTKTKAGISLQSLTKRVAFLNETFSKIEK